MKLKSLLCRSTRVKRHFYPSPYLNKLDIKHMIECASLPKHQCIIGLLYSAGLRVRELIFPQKSDIDIGHHRIYVHNPRTKLLRSMHLSEYLIPYLKQYRRCNTGHQHLFGGYMNMDLTPRAVQLLVTRTAWAAGIERKVTPSMLRNSFAVHLLQVGIRPEIVKELLGLESEQSMQKYILTANMAGVSCMSPLE